MKNLNRTATALLWVGLLGHFGPLWAAPVSARQDVVLGDLDFRPQTLDVDASGNIYVGGGSEIWVYDASGTRKMVWEFTAPRGLRVGPDGNIYIGRTFEPSSHIRVLNPKDGSLLSEFGAGKWFHGNAVGYEVPRDELVDPDGNVWSPNTDNMDEPEAQKVPNLVFGGLTPPDSNGGRLMRFNLKTDPQGKTPTYFGTFSNIPPDKGGPGDALHQPYRVALDTAHKKLFVLDDWGVTRWSWPAGAFEKRILAYASFPGQSLLATTPVGTFYIVANGVLSEYDSDGKLLGQHPEVDVNAAYDLRVTADGSIYLCYGERRICFEKYSAPTATTPARLTLCRGVNVVSLNLALQDGRVTAGQRIPITATIEDRRKLYNIPMPELDEIKASLWLREYRQGAPWKQLAIEQTAGQQFTTIPADVSGAIQLRLSASAVTPDLLDNSGAFIDLPVGVRSAAAKNGTLSIVTDRNQTQFVAGQWMRLNLIGRSTTAVTNDPVQIQLTDNGGKAVTQGKVSWSIPAGSATTASFDVRLADGLKAGEYELKATSAALGEASLSCRVALPVENGRFKMFADLSLNERDRADGAQAYVDIAAQDGITHDVTRYLYSYPQFGSTGDVLEVNRSMRAALAGDPTLPAPETAELSTGMRSALNTMAAHGMHFWPEMMGWEDDTVNRTDVQQIKDKQNLGFWTQWGLASPAQDGFLWDETNWWGIDHARLEPEWSRATGKSVDLLKGLDWGRLDQYNPLLTGTALDAALSYHEYMAKTLYPENYQRWKQDVESMRPRITGAGVPLFAPSNWPPLTSQSLDTVVDYQQIEQVPEAYARLESGAFMRHEGKPFVAGLEDYADTGTGEYLGRQLLPGLLYGAEGLWANQDYRAMMSIPLYEDQLMEGDREALIHQAIADLKAVLEPVGTRLRQTHRRAELGIYFPRAAWVQMGHHAFGGDNYHKHVDAAIIAAFHAHLQARVVFDEEVDTALASGVKFLLLPGLQSDITSDEMAALQKFKSQGGTILVAQECAATYQSLGPAVNVDFGILAKYGWYNWYQSDDRLGKRLDFIALAKQMTTALALYVKPAVQIDDPDIWYSLMDGSDNEKRPVTYLVAINQNQPAGLTPSQLWKMTASYTAVVPVIRSAVVPAPFRYAYDLLAGKAIPINHGQLQLDFSHFAGRVIALSASPLTAADLREKTDPVERETSAQPVTKISTVPDVDLFEANKIRSALQSKQTVYLSVAGDASIKADSVIKALQAVGLTAQLSSDPSKEVGIHLAVCSADDELGHDPKDMLPVRLSEDVPGRGRAILMFMRAFLPGATDAVVVAVSDEAGLAKASAALGEMARSSAPNSVADTRLIAPAYRSAPAAPLNQDTIDRNWGARLASIRAVGPTVAVGAAEWGNNLFLLDNATGHLLAATKAGRYYVDDLWMSGDGQSIGAEAIYPEDVNGYLELFNRDGKSLARYARDGIDDHSNSNGYSHTMRLDIFSFALSPDGKTVYSSSNLGLTAMTTDGRVLWRHDYASLYTDVDILRSKWSARIDLTPDGRYLAVGLTHEVSRNETDPPDTYNGVSKVSLVDAQTGQAAWEATVPRADFPMLAQVKIAPNGRSIAAVDVLHGLMLFRDGQLIKQRQGPFRRIAWSDDSKTLFALSSRDRSNTQETGYGFIALDDQGLPTAQYEQYEPIIAISPAPGGSVALMDSARQVRLISREGKLLWTAKLEADGALYSGSDAVFACDWHGNVYKLDLTSGACLWKTNVTAQTWRPDMESLPAQPYAGPTFGVHPRRPGEQPLEGNNLAPKAQITAGVTAGWGSEPVVNIDPKLLVDGQLNQLKNPWLGLHTTLRAAQRGRYIWMELDWPVPVSLRGVSIHEDEAHPESWPYECCLQAWQDGAWKTVAVSLQTPGPWHNLTLSAPTKVDKIRYCITSIMANNAWTDEIRAIEAP